MTNHKTLLQVQGQTQATGVHRTRESSVGVITHFCVLSIDWPVYHVFASASGAIRDSRGSSAGTCLTHRQTAVPTRARYTQAHIPADESRKPFPTLIYDVYLYRRRRTWAGEHGGLLAGFYRQGDHADLLWCHPTASWAERTCNQTAGNWHRWHHHYVYYDIITNNNEYVTLAHNDTTKLVAMFLLFIINIKICSSHLQTVIKVKCVFWVMISFKFPPFLFTFFHSLVDLNILFQLIFKWKC